MDRLPAVGSGFDLIQATMLNPDMCNPDFRLNQTDWKVAVPSYTYNSYTHNPDRNFGSRSVRIKQSCLYSGCGKQVVLEKRKQD